MMYLSDQSLLDELKQLESLERSELILAWTKVYDTSPFKGIRKPTLIRGLAYHVQRKRFGGLKPNVRRQLLRIAKPQTGRLNKPKLIPKPKAKPGSQIIREWNGRTHVVEVKEKGYIMGGITYKSLSAAAKAITGAHWSGPRFFGVEN